MTRDEFMHLTCEQRESFLRSLGISQLKELATDMDAGWMATVHPVHAYLADNERSPEAVGYKRYYGSYFDPEVCTSAGGKVYMFELAPIGLGYVEGPQAFNPIAFDEAALRYYFNGDRGGWRRAWNWARRIAWDTGKISMYWPDLRTVKRAA